MMPPNYYRSLLSETKRIEPFRDAIQKVIRPGDLVLEIGTGLGTFAMLAADAGAKTVWAVDQDQIIEVARAVAAVNGYAGKIDFVRGSVPGVRLPQRATVLIYEDFVPRLLDERRFRLMAAVQKNYLTEGAVAVPRGARFFLALTSSELARKTLFGFGADGEENHLGVDWSASRGNLANTPLAMTLDSKDLVTEPRPAGEFNLSLPPKIDSLDLCAEWVADEDLEADGLLMWHDLELAEDIWISNAPGAAQPSWGALYLPLDPPLSIPAGSKVVAAVKPARLGGNAPGWLNWSVKTGKEERNGNEFESGTTPEDSLLLSSPDTVPILDENGAVESLVFHLTDGTRTLRDIILQVRDRFPNLGEGEIGEIVVRVLHGKVVAGIPRPNL